MEEGTETDVPGDEIGVVVGEPAQFRFFSSSVRRQDKPGDVLTRWTEDELSETDSLETALRPSKASTSPTSPSGFTPISPSLGMLELWCVATTAPAGGSWSSA